MNVRELINKLEELHKGTEIKIRIRDWDGFEVNEVFEEPEIGYDKDKKEYYIY